MTYILSHVTSLPQIEKTVAQEGAKKCVCVGGGGAGAHRHVIYVPSVKNQYKLVVFGYMVIY